MVRTLDRALADNLLRVSDRSHTLQPTEGNKDSHTPKKEGEFLRLRIRLSILTLALVLSTQFGNKSSSQTWSARLFNIQKGHLRQDDVVKQAYENLLSLYRDFAVLELRIQGELPAWEGILLVKERHRTSS